MVLIAILMLVLLVASVNTMVAGIQQEDSVVTVLGATAFIASSFVLVIH